LKKQFIPKGSQSPAVGGKSEALNSKSETGGLALELFEKTKPISIGGSARPVIARTYRDFGTWKRHKNKANQSQFKGDFGTPSSANDKWRIAPDGRNVQNLLTRLPGK
jgi:hypothetical protein